MSKILAEQVRKEILDALKKTNKPLFARELYEQCPTAESIEKITAQLGYLKVRGMIDAEPKRPESQYRGVKPILAYQLPKKPISSDEEDRLMTALESELMASVALAKECDDRTRWIHPIDLPTPSAEKQDGDEFKSSCCGKCEKPETDLVLSEIYGMKKLTYIDMHCKRLRALSVVMEREGKENTADWLNGLANELEAA